VNILHLEASPGWGGQEMRILLEAEGMRERGHAVILAVMRGGKLIEEARGKGFTVYELNFKRVAWPICLFQLFWIFRKHQIDLVNTHSSLDSWIGGIAARFARRKVVRTRHLSTPVKPGMNSRFVYGRLADFVVTTCASIIPPIAKQSGKSLSLFRSIATGVDPVRIHATEEERKRFRSELGLKEGQFLVGTACFMRSWKGIDDFLEAAFLLRNIPNLKWVVIGGGHVDRFHKKAKELHLDGIVYFTGHLKNPFPALGALDLFTLLSTANEGVSQAILQAAYLAKPLIATPTGGLSEICLEGKTGFQVPVHAPRAVADRVLKLYHDRALCEKLSRQARHLVLEKFTLQHTLDGMEKVYNSLS
jgi:glycosyltransferase involved in cell wall biosynthesis